MIDRHIIITTEEDRLRVIGLINANWEACAKDKPLHVNVSQKEEARRNRQNRYYWAMLKQIESQVWINGRQLTDERWHDYYRTKFLPKHEVPIVRGLGNGKWDVVYEVRPISTTALSVKAFADYVTEVEADAAGELGVKFYTLEQF